jgi:hypothetical protein
VIKHHVHELVEPTKHPRDCPVGVQFHCHTCKHAHCQ